jgi:hypothetical protein
MAAKAIKMESPTAILIGDRETLLRILLRRLQRTGRGVKFEYISGDETVH